MAALTDADGHVAGVTPAGLLQVTIDGTIAQANVGVKDSADSRINPATEETLEALRLLVANEDFASQATLELIRLLLVTLRDTVYRRTDSLPPGTNRIGSVGLDRPSAYLNRSAVHDCTPLTSGSQLLYTVTPGKTLYIANLSLAAFNTSITAPADFRIIDGLGGPTKLATAIPVAGTGSVAAVPTNLNDIAFLEPLQFNTDVRVSVVTGAVTFATTFTGYEE